MRILVDGIHLIREAKGVGLYTRNVLGELLRLDPELEISVLVLPGSPTLGSSRVQTGEVRWRNHLWHGFRTLPQAVAAIRPHVVWMPYETPLAKLARPYLMVCHDIPSAIREARRAAGNGARLSPGRPSPWGERGGGGCETGWTTACWRGPCGPPSWSSAIATSSPAVWSRISGVSRQRIRLAPCAPGADFASLSRRVDIQGFRDQLGLGDGYLLTFYTGDLRENPGVVPEVYGRLVAAGIRQGLVVAGLKPEIQAETEARFSSHPWSDRVRYVPFYGAEDLMRLAEIYTAASVYFDPSLHEGFDMQVLEAMACGTPVVCSDRGALPEVTAGAALLADPSDPGALAARLLSILRDRVRGAGSAFRAQLTSSDLCQRSML